MREDRESTDLAGAAHFEQADAMPEPPPSPSEYDEDPADSLNAQRILDEVDRERQRQDERWGGALHDDEHEPGDFLAFIDRGCRKARFHAAGHGSSGGRVEAAVRTEFIQIAALAVAAVESIDRKAPTLGDWRTG